MASQSYRIKIVRGDLHFEAEGDKKFVLQMLSRFDEPRVPVAPAIPEAPRGRPGRHTQVPRLAVSRATSPGEFIRQFRFKKHTDFVLAFGYYLEKHSGVAAFAPADINNCYYEAKMESSNTSQMIIQNIKRGFMMEAKGAGKGKKGAKKLYTLTSTGEEHLQKALARGREE